MFFNHYLFDVLDFESDFNKYKVSNKIKVVIATTNLKNEDYELLYDLANYVPVMVDSNYSSGITIIKKILNDNISLLKNFDISIIEKHHKYKKPKQ